MEELRTLVDSELDNLHKDQLEARLNALTEYLQFMERNTTEGLASIPQQLHDLECEYCKVFFFQG